LLGSWRNWQTRKVEGLVPERVCWFKSSRAHFKNVEVESLGLRVSGKLSNSRPIQTLNTLPSTLNPY
jgi:hypothetical protein